MPHSAQQIGGGNGYQGGQEATRAVTAGGHPADTSQPAFPRYHRTFGNPAPLGLFAFAGTTFVFSMFVLEVGGVAVPNVVVGLALAYGGLAQLLAGMWEFVAGNTFGATAFSSYGAFWISYAVIQIPWFGVVEGTYNPNGVPKNQLANAVGIYLTAWFIFTTILLIASFRSSVGLVTLFFFLDVTFLLQVVAEFTSSAGVKTASGAFGVLTSAIAWYVGAAGLLTPDTSCFTLPVIELSRQD